MPRPPLPHFFAHVAAAVLGIMFVISLALTAMSQTSMLGMTSDVVSVLQPPTVAPTPPPPTPTAPPTLPPTVSPTPTAHLWTKAARNYTETLFLVNASSTTFTGISTMAERNELYADPKLVRCGMLGPEQPGLAPQPNRTGVVLFVAICNCYDLLPDLANVHVADHRVALVDKRTADALKRHRSSVNWELLLLEPWPADFLNTPALLAEVAKSLSPRLFPKADWVLFADGKARFDVAQALNFAKKSGKSLLAARHLVQRPPKDEFAATRYALSESWRKTSALQMNKLDEHEILYEREGFFNQSAALCVPDIMIVVSKPRDPALLRVMCGWFNEITFLSMRGQLSFFYPLVRLKQMHLYQPLPKGWVIAGNHIATGCSSP